MGERKPVRLKGMVSANSEKTVVSKELSFPYILRRIKYHWPPGSEGLNDIKVIISGDPSAPATGEPQGDNVFGAYGNVDYEDGDDATYWVDVDYPVPWFPSYIKAYANNADAFQHTIDLTVIIEKMEREAATKLEEEAT